MNKYDSYKNVDLAWLKEVPSHWEVERISHIFRERKEKNTHSSINFVLSVMKDRGVLPYSEKGNVGNKSSEDISNYKVVYPNDLVLNSMNMMIGSLGKSDYKGVLSQVYYVLTVIDAQKYDIDYLTYIFKSSQLYETFRILGKGILEHRLRVPIEMLKYERLPIPPLSEQKQIADYLDWKINEIDKLIDIEREKVNQLETYKQKYIDKIFENIKSNDKIALSKLGNFIKGGGFSRENLTKSNNKAILYGDIYMKYNYWFDNCINEIDNYSFSKSKKVRGNVVLFTGSGETKEDIGKTVAYIGEDEIALGGDIIAYIPNDDINSKYISYFCNSSNIKYIKYIESTGEIIVHITVGSIKKIKVPLIEFKVQNQIVEKIDRFMENQEKLISIINEKIDNLISLKQSLISEVVTGKIDVRDIKIPYYEKIDISNEKQEHLEERQV